MIVTRSWLNEWIDLKGISTDELAKTFNAIGLEVDRVKHYEIPKNIVFGRVLECEKHPDADKLNVCKVDVGADEPLQIVCGAKNVRADLDVVVATLGAVMPNGMKIKPVKLRGVASSGMICSASEIGLEDAQDGILELDDSIGSYNLGEEVSTNLILADDLIEIELTANRGDCLSIRGVCRDLSAAFDRPLKTQVEMKTDGQRGIGRMMHLSHNKNLDINVKYKAFEVTSFKTPLLIQLRLAQIGEKRESAMESFVTYTTHSSGVIVQAYDAAYFAEETKTKIHLDIDKNGYVSVIGKDVASVVGVIQNDEAKVTDKTKTVLLEASYIPPDIISKKMYENKIESGKNFYKTSRGSEPEIESGISLASELVAKYFDATFFSGCLEYKNSYKESVVSVTKQDIDAIIGAKIDKVVISKILTNLGFNLSKSSTDNFIISVPQYRHDIVNKQDIIEEIVRLVGIDNIPSKPSILSEKNRLEDDYFTYKKRSIFRHRAVSNGFFETVHFVFDEKKTLNSFGFETTKNELELLNPIVQTLDTLRPTLLTGLLKAASQNVKNGYSSVKLFEIGSVFTPTREESLNMAFIFSGDKEVESLSNGGKPQKIDFATFVQKIADVVGEFELQSYTTTHNLSHIYQSAKIVIDGEIVGELFRVHPEVEKSYDLAATFMCEIEFSKIKHNLKTAKKSSKYQASFRDLSLIIPQTMSYETIKKSIDSLDIEELVRFYPVDRYSDENLGEDVSLSLRFVLQSDEKTLEEEDLVSAMDSILAKLNDELGVGLR